MIVCRSLAHYGHIRELVYEPAISLAAATVSSSSLLQELNATHIETKANIMAIIVLNFFIFLSFFFIKLQ